MYCNPFYNFDVGKDGIEIHDFFRNNIKFNIHTKNPKDFYKKVIEPAINNSDGIPNEDKNIHDAIKQLVDGMGDVMLYDKKDEQFYTKLFDLICKVNKDYPGLDTERLKKYMVENVKGLSAVVVYDKKMYPDINIEMIFPFKNIDVYEISNINSEKFSEAVVNNEWLIIAADTSDERLTTELSEKNISDHKLMIINHDMISKKIRLGPILIPSCTGGLERLNHTDFSSDSVNFRNEFMIEPFNVMNDNIFSKYVYAEIMNFILDSYSNYSTEYARLSGAQYEIDYDNGIIRRRECIL